MNTNLFYFRSLNKIGGIETFFYNLAQKYGKDFDITVMYLDGDKEQIRRLSKLVRTKKYRDGETVKCKRCFVTFNTEILDHVEAEEYYQVLHGDYRAIGEIPHAHPKLQKWVAVSKTVHDAYADITGKEPIVSYNPFIKPKAKKALRLISATRLTPDKGWKRMLKLAEALEQSGIPYIWDIYTDTFSPLSNPNIVFHEPRLDVINYIASADYFVQLSDAEGYCYSIVEALSVGTPVIVTDFPVAHEIGVVDKVNGFILPHDMSKLPLKEICKGLKPFKYTAPEDSWDKLLVPVAPDYQEQMAKPAKVRSRQNYLDLELKRIVDYGEEWTTTRGRAEMLEDMGLVTIIEE